MQTQKIKVGLMSYAVDNRSAKGSAVYARQLINRFKNDNRFDITLIHFEKSEDELYLNCKEIILKKFNFPFNKRFFSLLYFYWEYRNRKFDIIQWFQPRMYPLFWLAPTKKIIVGVHGAGDITTDLPFSFSRLIFNFTLKWFNSSVDLALVGSDFAARDIILQYGFRPDKVRVVHYGAENIFQPVCIEDIARIKNKYKLPNIFYLGIGRLNPNKNVSRVIKAFELFKMKNVLTSKDVHFVNIGAEGSEKKFIDSIISNSIYRNQIHLITYVETEDLPAVYCASQGVVFPLLNEGFGLPVIEAMYCHVPVIASDTCYPDITNEEVLLVNPFDENDIANKITSLFSDSLLREKLVKNSARKIKDFSWDNAYERLTGLYYSELKNIN